MRYTLLIVSAIIILTGCDKKDNTVGPTTESPLSVSEVINSNVYTFSINKNVFNFNDTIKAGMTATNIGTDTNTIIIPCYGFQWALVNGRGKTVMNGPTIFCYSLRYEPVVPHQTIWLGGINILISDTSLHGNYIMSADGLSLNLSIR